MIAGMLSREADSSAATCPCDPKPPLAFAAVHAAQARAGRRRRHGRRPTRRPRPGLDALAVWCACGLLLLLPGWLAVRALALEGDLGRAGCAPVAAALGLALWGLPLALAYVFVLPLGFVLAGVAAEMAALAAVPRGPSALPAAGRSELVGGAVGTVAFAYLGWRLSLPSWATGSSTSA